MKLLRTTFCSFFRKKGAIGPCFLSDKFFSPSQNMPPKTLQTSGEGTLTGHGTNETKDGTELRLESMNVAPLREVVLKRTFL